jgi:hypothetical protein
VTVDLRELLGLGRLRWWGSCEQTALAADVATA